MAGGGSGEKTEQATPKKKRDERKKGNAFSSKDLVTAFFILIIFFTMKIMGEFMLSEIFHSLTFWIKLCDGSFKITDEAIHPIIIEAMKTIFIVVGPIMLVSIVVNVLFTGAQTKFIFSPEALKFKMSRINPIEGFKKLFSIRSVVELVKSLLKIAVIAAIIYDQISKSITQFARLFDVDIMTGILYLCSSIFSVVTTIGAIFIGIGILDLGYQWWEYEKNLKMSKQEVKEEYKQMEGDPQIKGQIKQKQREMAQKRMMADVPTADVVVRNPTHFAVAIRYDHEKNNAPTVVAKGADLVAKKIIEIATEAKVIMTENKPLARALYDTVEIGQEIPSEFYQEVAEILAWVYDINNKKLPF